MSERESIPGMAGRTGGLVDGDEQGSASDQGVPVGQADVQADIEQGSGDRDAGSDTGSGDDTGAFDAQTDTEDFLQQARSGETEGGETIGAADVEADRRAGEG